MEAVIEPTCSDTAIGRMRFKLKVRADMIDGMERQIESLKSRIRNMKDQASLIRFQMRAAMDQA